ncbi:uncharacterized protein DS421_18g622110 [Arachis hypogaea]|nr:uncharacterized protein DS421_18g622110 [Arachis hypogaea]
MAKLVLQTRKEDWITKKYLGRNQNNSANIIQYSTSNKRKSQDPYQNDLGASFGGS